MVVNNWINENYQNISRWLRNVTRGNSPHLFEDFLHEIIIIFIQHPDAAGMIERGEARWFLTRVALNQWRSTTSPWAKQEWLPEGPILIDFQMPEEEYNLEDDALLELMIGILDDMHLGTIEEYYMSLVVMIYWELDGNFSEMSRRLGIPRTSLSKVYWEAISQIQTRLNQKILDLENGRIRITHDPHLVSQRWHELSSTAQRKAGEVHAAAVKNGFLRNL